MARDRRRLRRGTRAFAREVCKGEACVFVDHGFQWDGSNNVWLTRARASFVLGGGPAFDLRPRTLWTRVFGLPWRNTAIDPYFDEFFAVRTGEAGETWEALTTRARSLLVGSFEDGWLVSNGRQVTLWREGDFGREVDAEAAIELVAEVVSHGVSCLDALRRLPGAIYRTASGPWNDRQPPFVELPGAVPTHIGPAALAGQPVTAVIAPCGRATAPFSVRLDRDAPRAEGTMPPGVFLASSLSARVVDASRDLGALALQCDGQQVTLYMNGLETQRERLLSAANLVASFASGQLGGLYR
jgi:hypothetical protein